MEGGEVLEGRVTQGCGGGAGVLSGRVGAGFWGCAVCVHTAPPGTMTGPGLRGRCEPGSKCWKGWQTKATRRVSDHGEDSDPTAVTALWKSWEPTIWARQ